MAKGKHISLEDIANIFQSENNICAADEEMLVMLQHLASCKECLEKIKAHRRLDILLENWTPDLHGQAFRKMEALKQLKESQKVDNAEGDNEEDDNVIEQEPDDDYDSDYDHDHDIDEDCDDDCDCDCGHDHGHSHYKN